MTPVSTIVALASVDNSIVLSSTDPLAGNTVYANTNLSVGCSFWIGPTNIPELSGQICTSTALKFDIQSGISGRSIESAVLRLWPYDLPANLQTQYRVMAFADSWRESTITWHNRPFIYTSNMVDVALPVTTSVPVEIDVTAIVQRWANGEWVNNGLLISDTVDQISTEIAFRTTWFESMEYFSDYRKRPQLEIRLSP